MCPGQRVRLPLDDSIFSISLSPRSSRHDWSDPRGGCCRALLTKNSDRIPSMSCEMSAPHIVFALSDIPPGGYYSITIRMPNLYSLRWKQKAGKWERTQSIPSVEVICGAITSMTLIMQQQKTKYASTFLHRENKRGFSFQKPHLIFPSCSQL